MLGDVLLITPEHHKAARIIADNLLQRREPKTVLAISGESGSGKSELAHVVARNLKSAGRPAKILHSDNYYRVLPVERSAWRREYGRQSIGLEEYDWDWINTNLSDFRHGRPATLPCVDLLTDQVDRLITDFAGLDFLILEGLYAIQSAADLKIFIDLPFQQTRKAQLLRGKEPADEFRTMVLGREQEVVRSLQAAADWILSADFELRQA